MFIAFRLMLREPETRIIAVAALLTIAIGSVVYMEVEGWTLLDAVYFCVVTLATVGYGDLHPTTPFGRAFTILYIVVGVGILAAFITGLAKHRPMGLANRIIGRDDGAGSEIGGRVVRDEPPSPARPAPVVDPLTAPDPESPRTDIGPGG